MEIKDIAKGFHSLGSEPRLLVYFTLIKQLPNGLNITELQNVLEMKPSTLAHHLKSLIEANLVYQEKKGKEIYTFANSNTLRELCGEVLTQCCSEGKK